MGFNIKKISTSFDLTVQLTYITYKVHCKFSFLQKKKTFSLRIIQEWDSLLYYSEKAWTVNTNNKSLRIWHSKNSSQLIATNFTCSWHAARYFSLLLWPNDVFSLANPTCTQSFYYPWCSQKEFVTCVAHISKVKSNITETEAAWHVRRYEWGNNQVNKVT